MVVGRCVGGADGEVETRLVRLPGGPVRLPSLAIHLDRSVREGLTLDPQTQLVPVWGSDGDDRPLLDHLAGVFAQ